MDLLTPIISQLSSSASFQKLHHETVNKTNLLNSDLKTTLLDISSAWQSSNFCLLQKIIEAYTGHLDRCADPEVHLIVHLLDGTYGCEIGDLDKAHTRFEQASDILQSMKANNKTETLRLFEDDYYQAILSLKMAWYYILGHRLDQARAVALSEVKSTFTRHQEHRMVILAILDCLEADEAYAEERLYMAEKAYLARQNFAAVSAIRIYQADVYLNANAPVESYKHLKKSLSWLEQNDCEHLPFWWHPQIMPRQFNKAIELGCHPTQASRMLAHHRNAYMSLSAQYPQTPPRKDLSVTVNSHAQQVKHVVNINVTKHRAKGCSKAQNELFYLIETGFFDEQKLTHLAGKLPHGIKKGKLNPTILAVFGLHIQQNSNTKIAARLSISQNTVKTYLTKIYNAFELNIQKYPNKSERHMLLVGKATSEGYIL